MQGIAILWLCLFVIAAVGQMTACYIQNQVWRRINKPFVLGTLILFYLTAARGIDGVFLAALLFCLLGDILLLVPKLFKLGGLCFFAAHICYITVFSRDIAKGAVAPLGTIMAAVAYSVVIAICIMIIKKGNPAREMLVMMGYMTALGMMSCSALMRWWCLGTTGSLLVFAGSVLFMLSDFTISLRSFRKDIQIPKVDFIVMATYAPAQFLICLGMSALL